jgi:hypothetical protein
MKFEILETRALVDPDSGEIIGSEEFVANTIVADLDFVEANYPGKFRQVAEEVAALDRKALVVHIDDSIAAIYARWMRFESEYVQREAAARAFQEADYQGDPGVWVTSFAAAAGMAARTAADLIVSQADDLRAALEMLGALRMRKYEVLNAADDVQASVKYAEIIAEAQEIEEAL